MRRREFIGLLGGAVQLGARPRAQQPTMPVVGVLHSASPDPRSVYWSAMAAFRRGVSNSGFLEGQNVSFEFRWAEDQFAHLPLLAAELVRENVSLIFAGGGDVLRSPRKRLPPQYRLCSLSVPIRWSKALSPVSAGRVVTSLV